VSEDKHRKAEPSPLGRTPAAKTAPDEPVPSAAAEPGNATPAPRPPQAVPVTRPAPLPSDVLPTLPRSALAADKFAGLPRPSIPLPPPSEPRTLVRGEAIKVPAPPIVPHSRSAPQPPQAETAEPANDPQPAIPEKRTASIPPSLPRTGFFVALDRSKALLGEALAAVLARSRTLAGKVRLALPAGAVARIRGLLDKALAALPTRAQDALRARPPWLLPVVTIGGLLVGVGLVGLLFSLGGHGENQGAGDSRTPSSAVVPSSGAPSATAPSMSPCAVAGAAAVVAPVALVAAGVEARSLGKGVALGFAPSDHEAAAVRLDSSTLATTGSASAHSVEPIRRVRPVLAGKDTLGVAVDADMQVDRVRGRRTLPLDPPLQAGALRNDLVWMRPGGPPAGKLWSLDHSLEDLDALRGASETSSSGTTTAIAFRHDGAIWVGVASGNEALTPSGALSHIEGLGRTIGSPAVAIDEGVVMIAWADRRSSDEPWRLRIAHMNAGEPLGEPVGFTPPPGGSGGHVMSPGLAALPGRRFFLVWTEGPTSEQRVRGVTLTRSGQPVGKPLEISNEGVNSGQGQVAVTASPGARGVVAFLAATEGGFELAARPIVCGL